jgi:hypothetical protein
MKSFVRDSTVSLKFNFYDSAGAIVNPGSAGVTISYVPLGQCERTFNTYDLTQSGNDWSYNWDSSIAEPGVVYAHAKTGDVSPVSSADVEFRLTANCANRELTGD